jgi:iron complex outermembrane recepter protein
VDSGLAVNTKINSDIKLPLDIGLQLVFNYESPEIEAQGKNLAQYFPDASVQKNIFNKKAVVAVSTRDDFDTLRFGGTNDSSTLSQSYTKKKKHRLFWCVHVSTFDR